MRNGVSPPLTDFDEYVLAASHGFDDLVNKKRIVVIPQFEQFCQTHLEKLAKRCCLTEKNVGKLVAELAKAWKGVGQPPQMPPFIPPTLTDVPVDPAPLMHSHGWLPLIGRHITSICIREFDLFARDTTSTLCHRRWDGGSWSDWKTFQNVSSSSEHSVAAYSSEYLAIYALEANRTLREIYFSINKARWISDSTNLNDKRLKGTIVSCPTPLCQFTPPNLNCRMDLFAIGTESQCMHAKWVDKQWHGWSSLDGTLLSDPVAIYGSSNRIDIFALGADHTICHRWTDGSSWKVWESLGGRFISKPVVLARDPNYLDIFALGTDHAVWHKSWNGICWTPWEWLGETSCSIACVFRKPNCLDVFVVGIDGVCKRKAWNGAAWSNWQPLGGIFASSISASYLPGSLNQIMLVGIGIDSICWYKVLN